MSLHIGLRCTTEARGQREAWLTRQQRKLEVAVPFFKHGAVDDQLFPKLPHWRDRTILRGMRRDVMATAELPAPLETCPKIPLSMVLLKGLPNTSPSGLTTDIQKTNLENYLDKIALDRDAGLAGTIAIFELGRGFGKSYPVQVSYDHVPPLRASGAELFVVSVEDCKLKPPLEQRFCRRLHESERLALQGHAPSFAEYMPKSLAKFSAGNAWAVPSVACICIPMLREIAYSGVVDDDGNVEPLCKEGLKTLVSLGIDESMANEH